MAFNFSKPLWVICIAAMLAGACGEPLRPRSVTDKSNSTLSRERILTSQTYCYPGAQNCTTTITWKPANYFCGEDCYNGPAQMNPITGTFSKPVYRLWLNLDGPRSCYGTQGSVTVYNVQGRQVEQRDLVLEDTTGCGDTGWTWVSWTGDTLQFRGAIASITITAPQPATFHVNGGDPDTLHGYVRVTPTTWYYETRPPSVDSCFTGDELLDQQAMRDLLADEWNNYAHIDSIPSKRREVRGWLFEDSTGNLIHSLYPDTTAVPPDTLVDTPCFSDGAPTQLPGIPLAGAHSHPFAPGDTLPNAACKFNLPTGWFKLYDVAHYGGPSEADINAVNYDGVPHYIMDKVNIYAVPVGTTKSNARTKVKRFPRVDPVTGCRRV